MADIQTLHAEYKVIAKQVTAKPDDPDLRKKKRAAWDAYWNALNAPVTTPPTPTAPSVVDVPPIPPARTQRVRATTRPQAGPSAPEA